MPAPMFESSREEKPLHPIKSIIILTTNHVSTHTLLNDSEEKSEGLEKATDNELFVEWRSQLGEKDSFERVVDQI